MAEVRFLFCKATPAGPGLFFLDITWDGDDGDHESGGMWWTWNADEGWCGPIGRYINPRTGKPYRRRG